MGEGLSWEWAWQVQSPGRELHRREGKEWGSKLRASGALKIKLETGLFQDVEKPLEGVEQGSYMICLSLNPPLPQPTPFHANPAPMDFGTSAGLSALESEWEEDAHLCLSLPGCLLNHI